MANIGDVLLLIKDEIALTVDQGLPVTAIWKIVTNYLEDDKTPQVPLELLDYSLPNPSASCYPALPLDSSLRNDIWSRLQTDKDITIGLDNAGHHLSFDEAEAGIGAENQSHDKDAAPEWRLYASESLQWRKIAGHDIDTVRLFPTLWGLLRIIAKQKEEGILQPVLTAQSGQDARSVGPRTKDLAGKGYIMKIPVIAMKMRTSKLILKRFYKGAVKKRKKHVVKRAAAKRYARSGKRKNPKPVLDDEPLDIEETISSVFKLLKSAKNKVVHIDDVKFRVGCDTIKTRRKAFRRILNKLESMGCIKTIRAVNADHKYANLFDMGAVNQDEVTDLKNTRFSKCIKFVRDLRPMEWNEAMKGDRPGGGAQDDSDEFEEFDSDEEQQDDGFRVIRKAPMVRRIEGRKVMIPLWKRNHLMHTIYDQVYAAGSEGVRSGILSGAVFGPFYYRPFDQIMGRWTTCSQQMQPDHLKSTSLLRETDLYKRTASYRYWTTEHFRTMIQEKGLDYEADDAGYAFKISKKEKKKRKLEQIPQDEPKPLDENGFPTITTRLFVKGNGRGTFQECQNAAPKKGSGLKPRPIAKTPVKKETKAPEKDSVKPRKQKKSLPITTPATAPAPSPPPPPPPVIEEEDHTEEIVEEIVAIGRKRKYPPGTEPYLKPAARLEAVKKALRLGTIREVVGDAKPVDPEKPPPNLKPLVEIDETSWTIEMVSERNFLDLLGNISYQVPLATEKYRNSHGRRGRPKNAADAPVPEVAAPNTAIQFVHENPEDPSLTVFDSNGVASPAVRNTKRRKTTQKQTDAEVSQPESARSPQDGKEVEKAPVVIDALEHQVPQVEVGKPPKPKRAPVRKITKVVSSNKGKANQPIAGSPDSAINVKATPKRKSKGREKGTQPKKIKLAQDANQQPEPSKLSEAMDIDNSPVAPTPAPSSISLPQEVGETRSQEKEPAVTMETSNSLTPHSSEPLHSVITPVQTTTDKQDGNTQRGHKQDITKEPKLTNTIKRPNLTIGPLSAKTRNLQTQESDSNPDEQQSNHGVQALKPRHPIAGTPSLNLALSQPLSVTFQPEVDENGIRLEIIQPEVPKNKGIGGVLKASRRQAMVTLLGLNNGAFAVTSGYHKFVQHVKESKTQNTTVDRRTFNSIVEETSANGKLNIIGVFKGNRRVGAIAALPEIPLTSKVVQAAKDSILEEVERPFLHRQKQGKYGAEVQAKAPPLPIERVDFQRLPIHKAAPLSEKSNERLRLDPEKLSTLHRLQAITETQKDGSGRRRKPRSKASASQADEPIPTRTRSRKSNPKGKQPSVQVMEDATQISPPTSDGESYSDARHIGGLSKGKQRETKPRSAPRKGPTRGRQRSSSVDSVEVDVPDDTLHRWQLRPDDAANYDGYPNAYGLSGAGRQMYTHDEYSAAASQFNSEHSMYGKLQPDPIGQSRQPPKTRGKRNPKDASTARQADNDDTLEAAAPGSINTREKKKRGRKETKDKPLKAPKGVKVPKIKTSKPIIRIRTTPEEDIQLTLAVIIIRTLFGGYVRAIKWDLVAKALPQYDAASLRAHWPRVRAHYKEDMPRYQEEFEEQYLRAFHKEELPLFNKNHGISFDLQKHIDWFMPLVTKLKPPTERRVLPYTREAFDNIFDAVSDPPDWRKDFFSYMSTMAWKEHQLKTHPNSLVKFSKRDDYLALPADKRTAVNRVKNAWRSIFITEDDKYDDVLAKQLIEEYPEWASTSALVELHKGERWIIRKGKGGRYGTAAIQARVLHPWKTCVSTEAFVQAKEFHQAVRKNLEIGGNEVQIGVERISPGGMAWIFDNLIRGKIKLFTKDYKETCQGLADSLITRAIQPELFNFEIYVSAVDEHRIGDILAPPKLAPASLYDDVPMGYMKAEKGYPPFIWQNMRDNLIPDIWERVVRSIIAVLLSRPGATVDTIVWTLNRVINERDVRTALRWLLHRQGVVERLDGRYWAGSEYLWNGVSVA